MQIKEMLHTTYFRIRRYATGDPQKLCRFGCDRASEAEKYQNEIIELLTNNMTFKQALNEVTTLGYNGKRTAFEEYCRKLIAETGITYMPKRNVSGAPINPHVKPKNHYITKKNVLNFLWSGKTLETSDEKYIFTKYGKLVEIQQCIIDFRQIYNDKNLDLLECFIDKYSKSNIKPISSFASGLRTDINAVKNSVTSELSNGFVEGVNNKIKLIKRMMFGRAKIDLLRVRVLFAKQCYTAFCG